VLQLVVSVTERDGLALTGSMALSAFAETVCATGMEVEHSREVTASDVQALSSAWAKRLGIPWRRPAWLLRARMP
jgi:hypothetical protein